MNAAFPYKIRIVRTLFFVFVVNVSLVSAQAKRIPLKKFQITQLSDSLNENSGLTFFQGHLLTINDSGNSSEIFQLNTQNGKIEKVYQTHLRNIDWEAISVDSTSIFIGDFGNNLGTRKDLKVFKIPVQNQNLDLNSIKEFPFQFQNQTDFTPKNLNTDFDVEAMVYHNNKIQIFTKEWASKNISRYELALNSIENQSLEKKESAPIQFSATDAYFYENQLFVVGYTKTLKVFLAIFNVDEHGNWLSSKFRKIKLGNALKVGQVEGIAVNDKGIFISAERFIFPMKTVPSKLYFIPHHILKK